MHHKRATALRQQCAAYAPGNTDLSWTRITPWRALLAAALDAPHPTIKGARVAAEVGNPSADLLGAWLSARLKVPVTRAHDGGPGITEVSLHTSKGDIALTRLDGSVATYSSPGQPDRRVALRRRDLPELLTEELRRLDEDNVYAEAVAELMRLEA